MKLFGYPWQSTRIDETIAVPEAFETPISRKFTSPHAINEMNSFYNTKHIDRATCRPRSSRDAHSIAELILQGL